MSYQEKLTDNRELTSRYPMYFMLDEKVDHGYDGQKETNEQVSASEWQEPDEN